MRSQLQRRRSCRLGGHLQILRLRNVEFDRSHGHRWIGSTRLAYAGAAPKIIGPHRRRRQIWEAGSRPFTRGLRRRSLSLCGLAGCAGGEGFPALPLNAFEAAASPFPDRILGHSASSLIERTRDRHCSKLETASVRSDETSAEPHRSQGALLGGESVLCVHDAVAVSLFGQEPLAVSCEVSVHRVTGDDGVKARRDSFRLRSQQPAEPLRLLLSGPKSTRDLYRDLSGGEIDREVRHLADDKQFDLTGAECLIQLLAAPYGRLPGDQGRVQPSRQVLKLINILSDHQSRRAAMLGYQINDDISLGLRRRCEPVLLIWLSYGVRHPFGFVQGDPDLDAIGRRNVALGLDVLPRRVIAFRPDK